MGVYAHEPRVVYHFLELWYSYVVDVLTNAQVYADHAGKAAIDSDDVKLAIQLKVDFCSFSPAPTTRGKLDSPFSKYCYYSIFVIHPLDM